ncbi:MAG: acyl-CoA/acyl-ACP dehydrogenase, partial [Rhodoferax sp.]|nr:acyl-CoA/acyl-ACP dehydrogenase [Rhodoferax sp.]
MNRRSAEELLLERTRELVRDYGAGAASGGGRMDRTAAQWHMRAAQAGLLGLQVPQALGGLGLSFSCKVEALKILATHDFGLAMSLVNTHNVAEQIARLGHPDLVASWVPRLLAGECSACTALTERTAGSDFAAIQTRARAVPGGWQLDGVKTWITNATHAELMVVYAQTLEGAGASGIAGFVVDANAPGFQRQVGPAMGPVASMGTGGFALAAYHCATDDLLAPPGEAFKDILRAINGARIYVAAMCCAMVGECLRVASAFGGQRVAFGKPLHGHQAWRWTLANAA